MFIYYRKLYLFLVKHYNSFIDENETKCALIVQVAARSARVGN